MTESESKGTRRIVVGMYSFKTSDPIKLTTFWGQLMDLPLADGASSELAMLDFNHEHAPVTWLFERVDAADRSIDNRIGLDIAVEDAGADWAAAADRAEALGATRLGEHEQGGARWIEMRDPRETCSASSALGRSSPATIAPSEEQAAGNGLPLRGESTGTRSGCDAPSNLNAPVHNAASQVRDGRRRGGSAARHRPREHTGTASAFVTLLAEL